MTHEEMEKYLENTFTYHEAVGVDVAKLACIFDLGCSMAIQIIRLCPESREKSLALTKLEESVMWANASIARGE